jgi:hypothetical protein
MADRAVWKQVFLGILRFVLPMLQPHLVQYAYMRPQYEVIQVSRHPEHYYETLEGRKDGRKKGGWKGGRKKGRTEGREGERKKGRMEGRDEGWRDGRKEGRKGKLAR